MPYNEGFLVDKPGVNCWYHKNCLKYKLKPGKKCDYMLVTRLLFSNYRPYRSQKSIIQSYSKRMQRCHEHYCLWTAMHVLKYFQSCFHASRLRICKNVCRSSPFIISSSRWLSGCLVTIWLHIELICLGVQMVLQCSAVVATRNNRTKIAGSIFVQTVVIMVIAPSHPSDWTKPVTPYGSWLNHYSDDA